MTDLKSAFRALWKSPAFSLVAILTIAVGIGANTALFSVYDRLVLNPVTIPHPQSLFALWSSNAQLPAGIPAHLRRKILVDNPLATYDRLKDL